MTQQINKLELGDLRRKFIDWSVELGPICDQLCDEGKLDLLEKVHGVSNKLNDLIHYIVFEEFDLHD